MLLVLVHVVVGPIVCLAATVLARTQAGRTSTTCESLVHGVVGVGVLDLRRQVLTWVSPASGSHVVQGTHPVRAVLAHRAGAADDGARIPAVETGARVGRKGAATPGFVVVLHAEATGLVLLLALGVTTCRQAVAEEVVVHLVQTTPLGMERSLATRCIQRSTSFIGRQYLRWKALAAMSASDEPPGMTNGIGRPEGATVAQTIPPDCSASARAAAKAAAT